MGGLENLEQNYITVIDELEWLIDQHHGPKGEELIIALRLLTTEVERLMAVLREAGFSRPIQYESGKQFAKSNTLH